MVSFNLKKRKMSGQNGNWTDRNASECQAEEKLSISLQRVVVVPRERTHHAQNILYKIIPIPPDPKRIFLEKEKSSI